MKRDHRNEEIERLEREVEDLRRLAKPDMPSGELDRLRTEDEKHLIEMEKRYFGKLSFRADPALHAEQFKIVNVANNEELASAGG